MGHHSPREGASCDGFLTHGSICIRCDHRALHLNGSLGVDRCECSIQLPSDRSRPYAVVTTFIDITERKRMEEALRMREVQYSSLFDQSVDRSYV